MKIILDRTIKMHFKLICGFEPDDTYEDTKSGDEDTKSGDEDTGFNDDGIFKHYFLPMYGSPCYDKVVFGFEYGRVNSLYSSETFVYNGHLCFTTAKPPNEIVEELRTKYPGKQINNYAMIQDVYTSHYTSADVVFGYWVDTSNLMDHTDEGENLYEKLSDLTWKDDGVDGAQLIDTSSGHNIPGQATFIIGKRIGKLPSTETIDECVHLEEALSKKYYTCPLPDKDALEEYVKKINPGLKLHRLPVLTLVQNMCYCCT